MNKKIWANLLINPSLSFLPRPRMIVLGRVVDLALVFGVT